MLMDIDGYVIEKKYPPVIRLSNGKYSFCG